MDFGAKNLVSAIIRNTLSTKHSGSGVLLSVVKIIAPISFSILSLGATAANDVTNGSSPRLQSFLGGSQEPDQIDPRNGNLVIQHRDFSLPGNGGLDIEVWRRYDMRSASSGLLATQSLSYKWAAMGPGWTISAAPKISAQYWNFWAGGVETSVRPNTLDEMCNIKAIPLGYMSKPVLQHSNGDAEEIFTGPNQLAYTKSNWKISCVGGHLTATSPKGVLFDFGMYSERRLGVYMETESQTENNDGVFMPLPTETYFLAKSATDLAGNTLSYKYQQFGTPITKWAYNNYHPGESSFRYRPYASQGPINNVVENSVFLLSNVTSSDGRTIDFTYDPTSRKLLKITDGTGHQWKYEYVTLSGGSNSTTTLAKASSPTGEIWGYEYAPGAFADLSFNPGRMVPASPRKLIRTTNPVGGTATYTYGSYQYPKRWNGGIGGYVQGEQVTSRTLSNGNVWKYSFARGGAGALDTTVVTAPDGTYTYKFMGAGYKIRANPKFPSSSEYQNNAWQIGQLYSITDPLGGSEEYTWGNRVLTTSSYVVEDAGKIWDLYSWAPVMTSKTIKRDGSTFKTTYSNFDTYGNPETVVESGPNSSIRTTSYTYYNDLSKWIIGLKQKESSTATNINRTYNALGQLISEDANAAITNYSYDAQGNINTKTSPRGTVYTYTNYKRGTPQTELRPDGSIITRTVDDSGNVTSITDTNGNITEYTFDSSNRPTSEKRPLGNIKYTTYTPAIKKVTRGALVEVTTLDAQMNVKSVSVDGVVANYLHDQYGRRTFESQVGSSLGTSYKYDIYGRVTEIKNPDNSVQSISFGNGTRTLKDELGNTTIFSYKAYGSPEQTYLMGIASPISSQSVTIARNSKDLVSSVNQAGIVRTYEYNEMGHLIKSFNPETGISKFSRDAEGNIISKQVGSSNVTNFTYNQLGWLEKANYGDDPEESAYKYEGSGKVTSVTKGSSSRQFKYDANLNLISDATTSTTGSFETLYEFDLNDRISSITYPYTKEVVRYTNDASGRPIKVDGFVEEVSYWPSGMIKQIIYANGISTSYEQNSRLWPSKFQTGSLSSPSAYIDSSYGYDASGNLLSVIDTVDPTMNRSNSYDAARQIVGSNGPWGTGSFSYDGAGNLTSQTFGSEAINYQYNSSNLLSSTSGANVASYSYDAYGNITNSTKNDFSYDDVPSMQCANCTSSSRKVIYYYDPMNMRSGYAKSGVTTSEIRDNSGKILGELNHNADTFKAFIYIGDKRVADKMTP